MVSLVERDAPALRGHVDRGGALLEPLAGAFQAAGLSVTAWRAATAVDVADLGSSWAKRLGIPARRPAWLLTATKPCRAASASPSP
jgi:hypothetical protein